MADALGPKGPPELGDLLDTVAATTLSCVLAGPEGGLQQAAQVQAVLATQWTRLYSAAVVGGCVLNLPSPAPGPTPSFPVPPPLLRTAQHLLRL